VRRLVGAIRVGVINQVLRRFDYLAPRESWPPDNVIRRLVTLSGCRSRRDCCSSLVAPRWHVRCVATPTGGDEISFAGWGGYDRAVTLHVVGQLRCPDVLGGRQSGVDTRSFQSDKIGATSRA